MRCWMRGPLRIWRRWMLGRRWHLRYKAGTPSHGIWKSALIDSKNEKRECRRRIRDILFDWGGYVVFLSRAAGDEGAGSAKLDADAMPDHKKRRGDALREQRDYVQCGYYVFLPGRKAKVYVDEL